MTDLWIAGVDAAGGYGGWGYALVDGDAAQGAAGGARRTTATAMALTALIQALEALTPEQRKAPLDIHAPQLAGLKGSDEPLDPPELWAAAAKALEKQVGGWSLTPGHAAASEFAEAWAGFALDIARGKGTFSSAIPKPNMKTLLGKLNAGKLN
jgi:hypothetical protein